MTKKYELTGNTGIDAIGLRHDYKLAVQKAEFTSEANKSDMEQAISGRQENLRHQAAAMLVEHGLEQEKAEWRAVQEAEDRSAEHFRDNEQAYRDMAKAEANRDLPEDQQINLMAAAPQPEQPDIDIDLSQQ